MKRLSFLLWMGFWFSANPFNPARAEMAVGVQGGLNFASDSPYKIPNAGMRTGLALGLNLELGIMEGLYFQPELMYLQKGESYSSSSYSSTLKLDFVEVPLLVKAKLGPPEIRFEAFAGPSFGFAVSRKVTTSPAGGPSVDTDVSSTVNGFDFDIQAGLGVEFQMAEAASLFLNGRYMLGLIDLDPTGGALNTRGILVVAGARFAF